MRLALKKVSISLAAILFASSLSTSHVYSQSGSKLAGPALSNGDGVVTGFSGKNPRSFPITIDLKGPSLKVISLSGKGATKGKLISAKTKFAVNSGKIGQVFGIALDDVSPPNIYATATSAFGLQVVDVAGKSAQTGGAGSKFMAGQFGAGGGPGSVWKIDGRTGSVSLFVTLKAGNRPNAGAGLGNISFDKTHKQFFVSDLDNGLVYRVDMVGNIVGSFDHGIEGRLAAKLKPAPMNNDGEGIQSADFSINNANTWGAAAIDRQVWGLAVHKDRLYYAVSTGPQIWSVGLNKAGRFGDDARIEIARVPGGFPVADMVFSADGRLIVSQRGGLSGTTTFLKFHKPKFNSVFHYRQGGDGKWVQTPKQYAIGFADHHKNASGGVAISCDNILWSTGDNLSAKNKPGEKIVNGLQGNNLNDVRPANTPPTASWFVNYNIEFLNTENVGHVGDVEIYRNCRQSSDAKTPTKKKTVAALPAANKCAAGWIVRPAKWLKPKHWQVKLFGNLNCIRPMPNVRKKLFCPNDSTRFPALNAVPNNWNAIVFGNIVCAKPANGVPTSGTPTPQPPAGKKPPSKTPPATQPPAGKKPPTNTIPPGESPPPPSPMAPGKPDEAVCPVGWVEETTEPASLSNRFELMFNGVSTGKWCYQSYRVVPDTPKSSAPALCQTGYYAMQSTGWVWSEWLSYITTGNQYDFRCVKPVCPAGQISTNVDAPAPAGYGNPEPQSARGLFQWIKHVCWSPVTQQTKLKSQSSPAKKTLGEREKFTYTYERQPGQRQCPPNTTKVLNESDVPNGWGSIKVVDGKKSWWCISKRPIDRWKNLPPICPDGWMEQPEPWISPNNWETVTVHAGYKSLRQSSSQDGVPGQIRVRESKICVREIPGSSRNQVCPRPSVGFASPADVPQYGWSYYHFGDRVCATRNHIQKPPVEPKPYVPPTKPPLFNPPVDPVPYVPPNRPKQPPFIPTPNVGTPKQQETPCRDGSHRNKAGACVTDEPAKVKTQNRCSTGQYYSQKYRKCVTSRAKSRSCGKGKHYSRKAKRCLTKRNLRKRCLRHQIRVRGKCRTKVRQRARQRQQQRRGVNRRGFQRR